MKRPIELLVPVVAALALAAPVAHAVSPVVRIDGRAWLTKTASGQVTPAVFDVDTRFSTDTPGADPFTVQRAVIWFPDHAGTNGPLFPTCSARQIARYNGNLARCPRGSKVGSGTVVARALQIGVTARGQVTMFNSGHGRSIAVNIKTYLPAFIDKTIEAPIEQLHGRYGEKLTIAVPQSLQEILDGVFVAVQDFHVRVTGSTRVHGVTYSYLKATRCPTAVLHGVFDLKDWTSGQTATATTDTRVRCSVR
jgi:hypothetical protein